MVKCMENIRFCFVISVNSCLLRVFCALGGHDGCVQRHHISKCKSLHIIVLIPANF
jgi:hypothetical protein